MVALRVPEAGGSEAGGRLDPGGPGVPTDRAQVPGDGRDRGPGPDRIPRRRPTASARDAAPAPGPSSHSAKRRNWEARWRHVDGARRRTRSGTAPERRAVRRLPECERGGAADGGGFGGWATIVTAVSVRLVVGSGSVGSTYILLNICG